MVMNMVMATAAMRRPDLSPSPRGGSSISRRSPIDWMIRGALAVLSIALFALSVAAALASVIRSDDPARAYALAPWDGRVTAHLALKSVLDLQGKDRSSGGVLAQRALRQDATAASAVTALGMLADEEKDTLRARRLFAYGQLLTRRDLPAQLWAIEDSVARGDVAETLRHYDIALRTSKQASEILFPILVEAIGDDSVRSRLTTTLTAGPPWASLFIEYAAANGANPTATASLFRNLELRKPIVSNIAKELLIARLVAKDLFEDAWSYYAFLHANAHRYTSRDPTFAAALSNPTLFDWQSVAADGLSASMERNSLDVSASTSIGGIMVRQVQMLPPGEYRLSGHSVGIDQSEAALPYWVLTCQDGREAGRVVVPNSLSAKGSFSGSMTVPMNCPMQTLALMARSSDAMSALSGQFDRVHLAPTGQQGGRS